MSGVFQRCFRVMDRVRSDHHREVIAGACDDLMPRIARSVHGERDAFAGGAIASHFGRRTERGDSAMVAADNETHEITDNANTALCPIST